MKKNRNCEILKGPLQISLDITNKCNFRCLHCYNNSGENHIIDEELSDEDIENFIHEIKEFELLNLCFCGGEPLLRSDLICKSTKILKNNGVKNIGIVTNGYLLTKEIAEKLLNSGIDNFQLSLDGVGFQSHDRLRNKIGSFDKTIDSINILKNCGAKNIDVAFTCTNFNLDEVKDTYYLCNELGINKFRTQPLMILGRANQNEKKISLSRDEYRRFAKNIYELKKDFFKNKNLKTKIEFANPLDHIIKGRNLGWINCMINIRANGDIAVSPYLPITVGNIKKNSIKKYWTNGLNDIWNKKNIKEISKYVVSPSNFGSKYNDIPKVWIDKDIRIDLIEDNKFINSSY